MIRGLLTSQLNARRKVMSWVTGGDTHCRSLRGMALLSRYKGGVAEVQRLVLNMARQGTDGQILH
jgi:hypothetical protein